MNSVKRTRGIRKMLQGVAGKPAQRYVTAGDRSCHEMIRAARSRRLAGPSDQAILAWAKYDLFLEVQCGFWEWRPAA